MDDLERACSINRYWTPENNEMDTVSVNPENWHETNLPVLSGLIVNEFDFFISSSVRKDKTCMLLP